MFKPNDKALCIHAAMDDATAALFSERLGEGRVYAVRSVDPEVFHDGHQCVYLVGIQGHVFHDGEEVGFCSTRFRQLGDTRAHETTTAKAVENAMMTHANSDAAKRSEPAQIARVGSVAGSAPLTKNQQKRKAIAKIITIIRNWQIDGTDDVEHAEGMRVIAALQARSRKLSPPNGRDEGRAGNALPPKP